MNMQPRAMKTVNTFGLLRKGAAIAICLFAGAAVQASIVNPANISSLNTGAGLYNANDNLNNFAVLTDANWTVSLLSTAPVNGAGNVPPGGIPSGPAYLVPNNIGFPFGYWLPNSPASSWLTYSTPTEVGGDNTGGTYQYQLQFTAVSSGTVNVSWLSDNDSWLYINGGGYSSYLVGAKPGPDYSTFGAWNTPIALSLTAGDSYTINLDVFNEPQGYGNPTGANVEFTGDVSVTPDPSPFANNSVISAVPEPATLISGALLLLPFGASTLRILRKEPRGVRFVSLSGVGLMAQKCTRMAQNGIDGI